MAKSFDELVDDFRQRLLDQGPYRYVWLDALIQRCREGGRVVNVVVVIATAAEHITSADGVVESIGFKCLYARNKEEFGALLPEFMIVDSNSTIFFVVFTKKETNALILRDYYESCRNNLMERSN